MGETSIQQELDKLQMLQQNQKEGLENYSHIVLSEDELIDALIAAKLKKLHKLEKERLSKIEEDNRRLRTMQWNFNMIKTFMVKKAKIIYKDKFTLDDDNERLFDLLCHYFLNDEVSFSAASIKLGFSNPSVKKGILMCGNFGVGKTWLMNLFSRNQKQCYHILGAKKISTDYLTSKDKKISDYYIKPFDRLDPEPYISFNSEDVFFQQYIGLCIDDLGSEDVKNNFGNKINVIGDLIEIRYAAGFTGPLLHGTTNLSASELKKFYGERVTSRMREIFNFIELPGEDRRK